MQAISQEAAAVMRKLIGMMKDDYLKLDNASGRYMAVVVEQVMDRTGFTNVYSVAHYGEQNGDLMTDPEMTFGELDGKFYPLSFRNDYLGFNQDVISASERKEPVANDGQQKELAEFAAQWFRNITEQQELRN